MNDVKLIDFDAKTLSKISEIVVKEIHALKKNHTSFFNSTEYEKEIENLYELNVQILYAFSIVKLEETQISN